MDDLKLYARNSDEFEGLSNTVTSFNDDICMEMELDKCTKTTFK